MTDSIDPRRVCDWCDSERCGDYFHGGVKVCAWCLRLAEDVDTEEATDSPEEILGGFA